MSVSLEKAEEIVRNAEVAYLMRLRKNYENALDSGAPNAEEIRTRLLAEAERLKVKGKRDEEDDIVNLIERRKRSNGKNKFTGKK